MAGKLCCIPGALPTLNDWEMHLGTLYPEVHNNVNNEIAFVFAMLLPKHAMLLFPFRLG